MTDQHLNVVAAEAVSEQQAAAAPGIQDITPAMVARAYRGRPGCCCGCRGKYFEKGSREIVKVLRLIQANESSMDGDNCPGIYSAIVGGKQLIVYLPEAA